VNDHFYNIVVNADTSYTIYFLVFLDLSILCLFACACNSRCLLWL